MDNKIKTSNTTKETVKYGEKTKKTKKKKKDKKSKLKKTERNIICVNGRFYKEAKPKDRHIYQCNPLFGYDVKGNLIDNIRLTDEGKIDMNYYINMSESGSVSFYAYDMGRCLFDEFVENRETMKPYQFKKKYGIYSDSKIDNFIKTYKLVKNFNQHSISITKDGKSRMMGFKDARTILNMLCDDRYLRICSHILDLYKTKRLDFSGNKHTPEVEFCLRHNIRFASYADICTHFNSLMIGTPRCIKPCNMSFYDLENEFSLNCNVSPLFKTEATFNHSRLWTLCMNRELAEDINKGRTSAIKLDMNEIYHSRRSKTWWKHRYDCNDIIMDYNEPFMVVLYPANIDEECLELDMELYE